MSYAVPAKCSVLIHLVYPGYDIQVPETSLPFAIFEIKDLSAYSKQLLGYY